MSEKLHSAWPILALDGVGETIGDARPAFVVTDDARFLHFANAAGARFLALSPARALQTRVGLEPRLAARLARFAAGAHPGDESRELMRVSDGLRSSLLSLTFRRPAGATDAILVVVDNQRPSAGDDDPAASLKALAAEGGLLALFDEEGDVIASLGDHHALDGIHTDVEAALDSEDDAAVFTHRLVDGDRVRDFALVRLGSSPRARRLMHIGPSEPVEAAAEAPAAATAAAVEVPAVDAELAAVADASVVETAPAVTARVAEAPATETAPAPLVADGLAEPATVSDIAPVPTEAAVEPTADVPAAPVTTVAEEIADLPAAPIAEAPVSEALIVETTVDEAQIAEAPIADAAVDEAPIAEIEAVLAAISPEAPEVAPVPTEIEPIVEPATVPAALVDAAPETEPTPPEAVAAEPAAAVTAATVESAADAAPVEPASEDEADVEAAPVAGFRHTPVGRAVKFVWQMDAERRFTLISDEFAAVVGPRAADLIGRTWREVAAELDLDGEGRVAEALDRRDTWSGRTVLWPIEGEALRLPVDLAALPAFDRGRVFAGFRGFGTIRGEEAVPDPAATGLRLARVAAPQDLAAPEETEAAPLVATDAPHVPDDGAAPQLWPGDTEVALVEAAHPRAVEPTLDGGEAAFAGEIDPPPTVAVAEPETPVVAEPAPLLAALSPEETATPSDWPDDELALAMATLPPCEDGDDGSFAGEIDEAPQATAEQPATEAGPLLAATVDQAAPASPAVSPDRQASSLDAPGLDAPNLEADDRSGEDEPHAAGDLASVVLPPVSPLALRAAGIALDDENDDEDDEPAADLDGDDTIAHAPITATRREISAAVEALAATEVPTGPSPALLAATLAAAPIAAAHLHGAEPAALPAPAAPDGAGATSEAPMIEATPAAAPVAETPATEAEVASEPAPETSPTIDAPRDEQPAPAATIEESVPTFFHPAAPHSSEPAHPSEPTPVASETVATAEPITAETRPTEPTATETTATEATPIVDAEAETEAPLTEAPAAALADLPPAAAPLAAPAGKVVTLTGAAHSAAEAVRLSPPERVAFRQIAEALGARIEGDEAPVVPSPAAPPRALVGRDPAKPVEPATPIATPAASPAAFGGETRLLDRLPTPVAVVKDEALAYANDAFLRLLGYADVAALQNEGGLDALFAGEHVARRWEASPDGSRPVPVLARDGRVIPVDAVVSTVPWAGASALMLTLTEATVTPAGTAAPAATAPSSDAAPAAALSDASLRERVGELEAIIDTATDGVLMLDAEGTILSANHAAEALFGTDRRDMIGRPLTERLAPESRRSAMDYLDGLARNGVASVLNDGREVIGAVERGGLIPMFMTIGRISAAPSRKYCAVLRDITHWKKSEEDLTAARRRAEEASVHKSDFLAKISHEIRTPLNAIIGFSEVMMDERFGTIGNDRYKDYLRDIHSSGSHIMSLINDLLDLSKVEAGKMDLRFEAVALGDIMSECVAMMQPQANRERIIIRSSLPSGVPPVVADPRSVRQVMLNLLSNAIKFTPSGGQVIVSTTLEDSGEVVMRVRDTGYGMTDKELQTAMEPFRQLHTTRSRGGGTGLGLPLTKALVEANRAVFRIDSTVGQGTLATVTFPVTRVLAS